MLESGLGMSRKAARGRKGREIGALKEQSCPEWSHSCGSPHARYSPVAGL